MEIQGRWKFLRQEKAIAILRMIHFLLCMNDIPNKLGNNLVGHQLLSKKKINTMTSAKGLAT